MGTWDVEGPARRVRGLLTIRWRRLMAVVAVAASVAVLPPSALAQQDAEGKNMVLLSHTDLAGNGDGGEGLAIQRFPDGHRILYLAHEGQKSCLSVVDVTRPDKPVLLNSIPSPQPGITRCNSLGLSGNRLAVADQTKEVGQKTAGMWRPWMSPDLAKVQKATSLQELALSFFDTSGPNSRGAHCLWFVDGEFVANT